LTFRTHLDGFTNRDLRQLTAQLRGLDPVTVTTGQTTYDLRRLRSHGLIERRPHSHRYRVTDQGLQTAMFLTRVHDRLLPTGLAHQADPHTSHRLKAAAAAYQRALDTLAAKNGLAA
jgi:DNA-binding PadR family transcriptional regulator